MSNKRPSVLVFDSGVGGLSITQTLHARLPHITLHYLSDNAAFPYGTKDNDYLIKRTSQVLKTAAPIIKPDIIIIACNTASTIALPTLRTLFDIPIVGVVPAIKPAAKMTKSKVIGLLATPGTVSRDYTQQLINDFANDCKVLTLGSSFLVQQAERKLRGEPINQDDIAAEVKFFSNAALDTVVLACTHFPLLKSELAQALPLIKYWVDSADAIANRVEHLLVEADRQAQCYGEYPEPISGGCYFTQNAPSNRYLVPTLKANSINSIHTLSLPI